MKIVSVALLGALLLAGCAPRLPPTPAVPPLPAETIPLPPVSEAPLMWRPGDWTYTGGSYRYTPGEYVPAEGHGHRWQFGRWAVAGKGYAWQPGGWVR